jgi:hypothetical protein
MGGWGRGGRQAELILAPKHGAYTGGGGGREGWVFLSLLSDRKGSVQATMAAKWSYSYIYSSHQQVLFRCRIQSLGEGTLSGIEPGSIAQEITLCLTTQERSGSFAKTLWQVVKDIILLNRVFYFWLVSTIVILLGIYSIFWPSVRKFNITWKSRICFSNLSVKFAHKLIIDL